MGEGTTTPVVLTRRFADAVEFAADIHRDQVRKDTRIPYVAHLLGAASFLLEQEGATEDQAIAALLHDALEDQPDRAPIAEIERRFGPAVARIVRDCTDADTQPKKPWRHRKVAYLRHLEHAAAASLQVSLADKLHNARAIQTDVQIHGPGVWRRFTAPPLAQRWYYEALAELFARRLPGSAVAAALTATVGEALVGVPAALPALADLGPQVRPAWVGEAALTGAAARPDGPPQVPDGVRLRQVGDEAWCTEDGRWWIEAVATGDPSRPLAVFVAPEDPEAAAVGRPG
jgi:hypothetical protein